MPPLNALDTWSIRSEWKSERPKSKCYLIGEGAHTEYWYFESLSYRLAKEGKPELIEFKPVERTEKEQNQSAPRKLLDHAVAIIESDAFIKGSDRVVVCFDADIFKDNSGKYSELLDSFSGAGVEVAVTYPSFELYLLLHREGAYQSLILPREKNILENGHAPGSRRRYIEKLASEVLGMNPKSNPGIGGIAANFEIALEQERMLNQDPRLAIGRLTSNVAKVVQGVIDDGAAGRTR